MMLKRVSLPSSRLTLSLFSDILPLRARGQVTLAGAPFVEELTGFPVGTIPPLGHRKPLPTLVDAELLKYSTIVGGAGCR